MKSVIAIEKICDITYDFILIPPFQDLNSGLGYERTEMERDMETKELLNKLTAETDLDSFFTEYEKEFLDVTFLDIANECIYKNGLKVAEIARNSGQGDYVYKVLNGERKPSRNIIIAIAIGMSATFEETQLLLRVSKFAMLDPRDRRDSIIAYAIKTRYDIDRLNDLLVEKGYDSL